MKKLILLSLLFVLPLCGCSYFKDRMKDASEVVEVGVGFSMGLGINARATKLVQAGFGSYAGHWAGLREGSLAVWEENRVEMGAFPIYLHEVNRKSDQILDIHHPFAVEVGYDTYMNDLWLITDRGFFEVGVTANVIALGADVAFDCAEFADFVLGWCGVDLLADDCYNRDLEELVKQVQSPYPDKRVAAVRALRRLTGEDFGYTIYTDREEQPSSQVEVWRKWKRWLNDAGAQHDVDADDETVAEEERVAEEPAASEETTAAMETPDHQEKDKGGERGNG